MACKPETEAQRLERIATQLLAGMFANPENRHNGFELPAFAIEIAVIFIKQLDALAIAE